MALSKQEFEKLRGRLITNPITLDKSVPGNSSGPNVLQKIGQDFNARVDAGSDALVSNQSPMSKALQTAGQGAGFVSDIVTQGVKAVTPDVVENAIGAGVSKVAQTKPAKAIVDTVSTWAKQHPEAAKNLQAIVDIASLLPIAKGASGAIKTAGKVTGKVAEGVSTLNSGVANATKEGAKRFYSTAIDPSVKEAEKIIQFNAENPFGKRISSSIAGRELEGRPVLRSDTAFNFALKGTEQGIGTRAKRYAHGLWSKEIQPALDKSPDLVTKDELFKPILNRIEKTVEPGKKKAYQEAFNAIQEDYAEFTGAKLSTAQKIKSSLDEFTPDKIFRGQSVANEYNVLKNDMANAIRQKIYTSLKDVKIRQKYLDYANLNELEKIGIRAITEGKTKGGFGSFVSAMWDKATTPVKTIGGRTLYRVGNLYEFTAAKPFKTLGDYMKSKGYSIDENGLLIFTAPVNSSLNQSKSSF